MLYSKDIAKSVLDPDGISWGALSMVSGAACVHIKTNVAKPLIKMMAFESGATYWPIFAQDVNQKSGSASLLCKCIEYLR